MNSPFMHRLTERIIEILVSLFLLLTIFPWIYLVMAIVVKRRTGGRMVAPFMPFASDLRIKRHCWLARHSCSICCGATCPCTSPLKWTGENPWTTTP